MDERVQTLRSQSLTTPPAMSMERAELVTEAYKRYAGRMSPPMLRALTFKHLMETKQVVIQPGELIVGERGPGLQQTPTYPELCCHTLDDLSIIDERPKISFRVAPEARRVHQEKIMPFWEGRALRDRMFAAMSPAWRDCYDAGIFTEFMEQRAPGHTVADGKIYRRGFRSLQEDIRERLAALDPAEDMDAYDKREQLQAMDICCSAIIRYAERHAEEAERLAREESDPVRRAELEQMAAVSRRVPAEAPRSVWEALQAYWYVHLGVITELNTWDSFNPGRLDQHLYPFYKADLAAGRATEEQIKELLQLFWIKFNNQPAPPKVGVTMAESGTYTDFANINVGGLRSDGTDGVNDVSYLLLDVIDEMRLLQPSSNIQVSRENPDGFIQYACRVIRKGWGQPSVFNADAVVAELLRQGKDIVDARCGGTSGCVETGAFGKEAYILTGYFNLVKILEITLHNGVDPRTGKSIGLATGDPIEFGDFDALFSAFSRQIRHFIDIKIQGSNVIERMYAREMPCPFLSTVIDDCIVQAKDYNAGGARYNTNYIQGVGIGTLTDSLSAMKKHVFEEQAVSMAELLQVLDTDFVENEPLRQRLLNRTPRYGSDDDFADELMQRAFSVFFEAVDGRPNTKGGVYRINMLPTTCHVYFGSVIGATAEGRRRGMPLSEGISPVQGQDRFGPTAVIKSAGKMDQVKTGGTLLNQKFSPAVLEGDGGLKRLTHLIRSYFAMDGHHIQFNVNSAAALREAQEHPEQYSDLIVRVAGYSDYFNNLSTDLQDEIIARTEHTAL